MMYAMQSPESCINCQGNTTGPEYGEHLWFCSCKINLTILQSKEKTDKIDFKFEENISPHYTCLCMMHEQNLKLHFSRRHQSYSWCQTGRGGKGNGRNRIIDRVLDWRQNVGILVSFWWGLMHSRRTSMMHVCRTGDLLARAAVMNHANLEH